MPKRKGGRKKVAENIYRTEHNTYEVKLSIHGRQVKRTVKTYKEALELRRKLDLERELADSAANPEAQAPRMTLGEYMRDVWTPRQIGTGRLAPETEQQYRSTLVWLSRPAQGLPEGLQAIELDAIGRVQVAAWTAMMSGRIKQSTALKYLKNAMRVMRMAKRDGLLKELPDHSDLLRKRPRAARESWVWRKEEVRAAIRYVRSRSDEQGLWEGHPVMLALLLFAGCGARKSEIFGLRWSDVELPGPQPFQPIASMRRPKAGTASITIRRQARWVGREWSLDRLKTPAARRTIDVVHPTLVEALRRQAVADSLHLRPQPGDDQLQPQAGGPALRAEGLPDHQAHPAGGGRAGDPQGPRDRGREGAWDGTAEIPAWAEALLRQPAAGGRGGPGLRLQAAWARLAGRHLRRLRLGAAHFAARIDRASSSRAVGRTGRGRRGRR